MPKLRIWVELDAPQSDRRQVTEGLLAFNERHTSLRNAPSVSVFLRDACGSIEEGFPSESKTRILLDFF